MFDKLKERLKAETHKYQQQYMGGGGDSAPPNRQPPQSAYGLQGQQQQQHNPQHCHFQARPVPQPSDDPSQKEVRIASVTELGNVRSITTHVKRDLGFAGQIGQHVLLSYGDTMYADNNWNYDTFRGMTSNSVALSTQNPLEVVDSKLNSSNGWPEQFVPINKDWNEDMSTHAVGITNVIETDGDAGEGIIFTLLNFRPEGKDQIVGAGIATVKLSSDPTPVPLATRLGPWIWGNDEPFYGDVGAVRSADYVYAYGHTKDNPWVYLARVPIKEVTTVECYEYWHGQAKGWSKDRLKTADIGHDESVFWQVNQGQVIWSPYLEEFLFLYCDRFWNSTLLLKHAPQPEGPWSDVINIKHIEPMTVNGSIYSAAPQPQFDPSGKTLIINYTNMPNEIQAVKVEFA